MSQTVRNLLGVLLLVTLGSCRCGSPAHDAKVDADAAALRSPPPGWIEGTLRPVPPGTTPVRGGRLVVRATRSPDGGLCQLHDRMRDREVARYTVGPVYETLLETDATGFDLRPRLAETWTSSEDGRDHLFRLREGVTFHDGAAFTARDVAATLRVVLAPTNVTTAMRAALDGITTYEVVDPRTIRIRWERPSLEGFRNLVLHLPILPADALDEDFNTAEILHRPIGTGPFRFESWDLDHPLVLERNEHYWREPAHLDAVEVQFVADPERAQAWLERGEFDLMTRLKPKQWREMEPRSWAHAYQRLRAPGPSITMLTWNVRKPLLADPRVRRALALLTPLDQVAEVLDRGTSTLADCPFAPGDPGCDPSLKAMPHDPAEAARLLEEAGWGRVGEDGIRVREGVRLAVHLLIPTDSEGAAALRPVLQRAWREGGVELTSESIGWSSMRVRMAQGDFDAAPLWWDFDDAVAPLEPLLSSEGSARLNLGGYANPEAEVLLSALGSGFDPEVRKAQRRALQRILREDPPAIFLTHPSRLEVAKARVHGLSGGLPWHDLRLVWLEPEGTAPLPSDSGSAAAAEGAPGR